MKTLIAVPCMDMLHTKFVHSLLSLRMDADCEVRFGASSLIYDTRNQLINYALKHEFERVIWFDSDMTFGPEILAYLNEDLDNGFDIVSGLCFKRRPPHNPVLFKRCDIRQHENGATEPIYEPYDDYPENSLFEIAACGFGCVMMSVPAVKDIIEQFGPLPFMPAAGFGEDLSFCIRARSAGKKVWCDSRAKLGHVGETIFNEAYWRGLKDGTS